MIDDYEDYIKIKDMKSNHLYIIMCTCADLGIYIGEGKFIICASGTPSGVITADHYDISNIDSSIKPVKEIIEAHKIETNDICALGQYLYEQTKEHENDIIDAAHEVSSSLRRKLGKNFSFRRRSKSDS